MHRKTPVYFDPFAQPPNCNNVANTDPVRSTERIYTTSGQPHQYAYSTHSAASSLPRLSYQGIQTNGAEQVNPSAGSRSMMPPLTITYSQSQTVPRMTSPSSSAETDRVSTYLPCSHNNVPVASRIPPYESFLIPATHPLSTTNQIPDLIRLSADPLSINSGMNSKAEGNVSCPEAYVTESPLSHASSSASSCSKPSETDEAEPSEPPSSIDFRLKSETENVESADETSESNSDGAQYTCQVSTYSCKYLCYLTQIIYHWLVY